VGQWLDVRLLVIAACGLSTGIHAALVHPHWEEDERTIAVLFVLASIALTVVAAALALRPTWILPVLAAAGLFAALIVAYILLRDEPFDAIAGLSKADEAVGLLLSLLLLRARPTYPGDLAIAYFGLTFVLGFSVAAGGHAH
jgi:hypothetical protein